MKKQIKMSLGDLWEGFKHLPWWEKAILIVPFVIAIIFLLIVYLLPDKEKSINSFVVQRDKERVDKEVEGYRHFAREVSEQRQEIVEQREEIRKELADATTQHDNLVKCIDNASDDELDVIAAKLRANSPKNRD